jgi:hypothetical protein
MIAVISRLRPPPKREPTPPGTRDAFWGGAVVVLVAFIFINTGGNSGSGKLYTFTSKLYAHKPIYNLHEHAYYS